MTGRPGHRTMETNGKSTVSYLVRTPRVPFFMLILIGLEAKNLLAFQGRRGIASVVRWNLRPVIFGVEALKRCSRTFRRVSRLQNETAPKSFYQESPRQTKPKKGPKRPWISPILVWILVLFLGKTNAIHIELWFQSAPGKSSWTGLSLAWFAGVSPDFNSKTKIVIKKYKNARKRSRNNFKYITSKGRARVFRRGSYNPSFFWIRAISPQKRRDNSVLNFSSRKTV